MNCTHTKIDEGVNIETWKLELFKQDKIIASLIKGALHPF